MQSRGSLWKVGCSYTCLVPLQGFASNPGGMFNNSDGAVEVGVSLQTRGPHSAGKSWRGECESAGKTWKPASEQLLEQLGGKSPSPCREASSSEEPTDDTFHHFPAVIHPPPPPLPRRE